MDIKNKTLNYILMGLLILINIGLLGISSLWGAIVLGVNSSFIYGNPEFSQLSSITLGLINIITGVLFALGIFAGIIMPFIYRVSLRKRLNYTLIATLVPILILMWPHIFFPNPDYKKLDGTKDGRTKKTYVWNTRKGQIVKIWVSEKPRNDYKENERIRWVRVK